MAAFTLPLVIPDPWWDELMNPAPERLGPLFPQDMRPLFQTCRRSVELHRFYVRNEAVDLVNMLVAGHPDERNMAEAERQLNVQRDEMAALATLAEMIEIIQGARMGRARHCLRDVSRLLRDSTRHYLAQESRLLFPR